MIHKERDTKWPIPYMQSLLQGCIKIILSGGGQSLKSAELKTCKLYMQQIFLLWNFFFSLKQVESQQ